MKQKRRAFDASFKLQVVQMIKDQGSRPERRSSVPRHGSGRDRSTPLAHNPPKFNGLDHAIQPIFVLCHRLTAHFLDRLRGATFPRPSGASISRRLAVITRFPVTSRP